MTEAEWLGGREPEVLLNYIRPRTTKRKLCLFACACCRRIWHLVGDERSRQAVLVAERYADGLATAAEMEKAIILGSEAAEDAEVSGETLAMLATAAVDYALFPLDDASILNLVCEFTVRALEGESLQAAGATAEMLEAWADQYAEGGLTGSAAEEMLCDLVHDIFGNPYRPVELDPAWLTPTVQEVARAIYEERAFDRLPILADALEEAGCASVDILNHGRQADSHVHGCWLVDALVQPAGQVG